MEVPPPPHPGHSYIRRQKLVFKWSRNWCKQFIAAINFCSRHSSFKSAAVGNSDVAYGCRISVDTCFRKELPFYYLGIVFNCCRCCMCAVRRMRFAMLSVRLMRLWWFLLLRNAFVFRWRANFILIESCFVPLALFRWGISKHASGPIMARCKGYEV